MKKSLIVWCVLLLACLGGVVFAEGYVGVGGGVFLPNSEEPGLEDFDAGMHGELVFGYKVHPLVALELGLGRYEAEYTDSFWLGDCPDYPCVIGYQDTYDVRVMPVTFTAKYLLQGGERFTFYVGCGVGYYFTRVETEHVDIIAYADGSRTEERLSSSQTEDAFGFHVTTGCDIVFTENFCLGCDAKWARVEPSYDWGYPLKSEDVELGGFMLGVNLKYMF